MAKDLPLVNILHILRHLNQCKCIILANVRTAQLLGLIKKLYKGFPSLIILELMLDQERSSVWWKLKREVQSISLSETDLLFVSSRNEIEVYSKRLRKAPSHIKYLPFHTNIVEPKKTAGGAYLLSAGRSGRDYATLAAAIRDLNTEVVVVSDADSVRGIQFPPNVKLYINITHKKYIDLMKGCRIAIVPLKPVICSTGQVVILEAMALGKPVIASDVVGTRDYIQSGINGILVPPGDSAGLRSAIGRLLNEPALENQLAENALECVKRSHTFEKYVGAILDEADQLVQGRSRYASRNKIFELGRRLRLATLALRSKLHKRPQARL